MKTIDFHQPAATHRRRKDIFICLKAQRLGSARNTKTIALLLALAISAALHSQAASAIQDNAIIGWDGDKHGVIAHLNGGYHFRRDEFPPATARSPATTRTPPPSSYDIRFGIYNNPLPPVDWYNDADYLPCLVTKFEREAEQCTVWIYNFGNKLTISRGNPPQDYDFVAIYSRITILNHGRETQALDPLPSVSPSLGPTPFPLTANSKRVEPGQTVSHDYVLAVDRFGGTYDWPSDAELAQAGNWDSNHSRMAGYWQDKLSHIVDIAQLPDAELIKAYKAGYIYTHIAKDGNELKIGEDYYEDEAFENDKVEILATLLTVGDPDALTYLDAFPISHFGYIQAKWKYPWLWAIYLAKTGDTESVRRHLKQIKSLAHEIHDDRCLPDTRECPAAPAPPNPNRLMRPRNGLEVEGHLAMDNWSALTGLASYRYICERLPKELECVDSERNIDERRWSYLEYLDLFAAVNSVHAATIQRLSLDYLPVDMYRSNDETLHGPWDANWAATFSFGHWAWDAYLLGVPPQDGVEIGMVDSTYTSRFRAGGLQPHNFGAYHDPVRYRAYSSSYNAGYGNAALRGETYRSEGIYAYQFMLENGQSGPFSWCESFTQPTRGNTPWKGTHPAGPVFPLYSHTTGQATATKVLVDSLIALRGDGSVIIGRGVPNAWVIPGKVIEVSNFPIANGGRMRFILTGVAPDKIRLDLLDAVPGGDGTILDLQVFKDNIRSVTAGSSRKLDGTVTLSPGTRTTTVTLITPAAAPKPTPGGENGVPQ